MRWVILFLAFTLCACTSTNFTKTGFEGPPPKAAASCDVAILQQIPTDRRFIELGICATSVPGGGIISDATPKAIRELQDCACQNGGNAVLLQGDSETGIHTGFGYSQQRIKARATVLYIYPFSQ